ncbi:hypothetical protein O181_008605 [Austropuccinia psidii MF-1]|uniref:Uncharacterized protein n=1 Tax=Austropuccinia psidii MF-1 TaxID=1389203 RepID=A0A9Q3BPP1_9BASI|nr:hypothetical protein [Austropuccinia psidii MF-1]
MLLRINGLAQERHSPIQVVMHAQSYKHIKQYAYSKPEAVLPGLCLHRSTPPSLLTVSFHHNRQIDPKPSTSHHRIFIEY